MTDHHPLARSIPRTGHNTTGGMRTAIVLLLFAVLLTPSLAFSQPAAPACPPPPAIPSAEEIQAMFTTAKDRGFLWKYDKDGHAGYLFGSIHLGRRDWIVPGPKTMAALQSSGVIALELDVLDPQIHAQLSDPAKAGIARVITAAATAPDERHCPSRLRIRRRTRRTAPPDATDHAHDVAGALCRA